MDGLGALHTQQAERRGEDGGRGRRGDIACLVILGVPGKALNLPACKTMSLLPPREVAVRETFVPSTVMARENSWDLGGDGVDDINISFFVMGVVGFWMVRGLTSTTGGVRPSQVRAGIMGMMEYRMAGTINGRCPFFFRAPFLGELVWYEEEKVQARRREKSVTWNTVSAS